MTQIPSAELAGLTVLVVDDEPEVLDLLRASLEFFGARVVTANSGRTALRRIDRDRPDVIVSDICMPQMDGREFLRLLRSHSPLFGGAIPVIAFTALRLEEGNREKLLSAGFEDVIQKPADLDEMAMCIKRLAG